jgi:hypothetical protein
MRASVVDCGVERRFGFWPTRVKQFEPALPTKGI